MPDPILENIETRYLREYLAQLPIGVGNQVVGTDLTAVAGLFNNADAQAIVSALTAAAIEPAIQNDQKKKFIFTPQMFGTVLPGVDCILPLRAAREAIRDNGGGILYLPRIGGMGYSISECLKVDFSNCFIVLDDDCRLTQTTSGTAAQQLVGTSLPICAFYFGGSLSNYLENVGLIAPNRKVRIDANGRNVPGYTYDIADLNVGVLFRRCRAPRISNIYVYNGLRGGISTEYTYDGGEIIDCWASDSVYDNGIYSALSAQALRPYDQDDPSTWCNIRIVRPMAWNCRNFGVGSYGAVGVVVENPKIWNCGNNDNIHGPGGGVSFELDPARPSINYRCSLINPEITNVWGQGIFVNVMGTFIEGGYVRKVKAPTAYASNIFGNGLELQGYATDNKALGLDIEDIDRNGLRLDLADGQYPGIIFEGRIRRCAQRAVYGLGVSEVRILPGSVISNNGTAANGLPTVSISNQTGNSGAGVVEIAGRFDENQAEVANIDRVADVRISAVSGANNAKGSASPAIQIQVNNSLLAFAGDIKLSDANAKQARVIQISTGVKAIVNAETILGDSTSTSNPNVRVSGVTTVLPKRTGVIVDAAITLYASRDGSTQVCATPLTANRNVVLDIPTASEGDTFTVSRTTASTGAFTLNVIANGVTLKAVSVGSWVQVTFVGGAWIETMAGSL